MRLGKLEFDFLEDLTLSTEYNLDEVLIDTGIMKVPRIRLHGTCQYDGLVLGNQDYAFRIKYDDIEWNSVLTPESDSNPTKGGEITFNCIIAPYEIALGKSSQYYKSIDEAISTLCAGWIDANSFDPPNQTGYFNQQGENNIEYIYKIGSMAYAGNIPALTQFGFRFVDFYDTEAKYDLTQLGGTLDNSGSVTFKSPKTYKVDVDLFEVTTTSDHNYGTMREGMNVQIVGSEYFSAFRAKSINDQLLEDSNKSLQLTFSDFAPCYVGDIVEYELDRILHQFLITSASWKITPGGPITTYRLFQVG
jgi:hypothetical protein